jgi:hypothetical protein
MRIISISSNIAGHACAIGDSIRKYFYNNRKMTDFFDYLEVHLHSVNELLAIERKDIYYLNINNDFVENKHNKISVSFKHFQRMISHHDLNPQFDIHEYDVFIDKYIRRYNRLMDSIENENLILFIRFGKEEEIDIVQFIENIKKINPTLQFYFVHLDYDKDSSARMENLESVPEYSYLNLYDESLLLDEDLYFQTLEYSWDKVKMHINNIIQEI